MNMAILKFYELYIPAKKAHSNQPRFGTRPIKVHNCFQKFSCCSEQVAIAATPERD